MSSISAVDVQIKRPVLQMSTASTTLLKRRCDLPICVVFSWLCQPCRP